VKAALPTGIHTPLPINHETIEMVFGEEFEAWASANSLVGGDQYDGFWYEDGAHAKFLETKVAHHTEVTNSRQHVENSVGKELCDLFFAPYTKKMWGLDLEELPASVAARIPTNVSSGSYDYFPNDEFQCVPKDGYTAMFARILAHENITVRLNTTRQELMNPKLQVFWQSEIKFNPSSFDHIFTSEPIDAFFGCSMGELPWRSIKMHTYSLPVSSVLPTPVVNFTHNEPFTRITEWKKLPAHGNNPNWTTLTAEQPCDYRDNNMERYYPVKTSQRDCPNRALYNQYVDFSRKAKNITFIGRCGTYQYLDMWMVIAQSLKLANDFLNGQSQK
jgi:UDP-galactopyranose mutase